MTQIVTPPDQAPAEEKDGEDVRSRGGGLLKPPLRLLTCYSTYRPERYHCLYKGPRRSSRHYPERSFRVHVD